MGKFSDKLAGKKIAVIGGSSGIGYGAAEILLDAGAHVTVISSTKDKVEAAVARLRGDVAEAEAEAAVQGLVGDVRDEAAFTQLLVSLAPLDHVVFSGVDKIIRGPLADADLDEAKALFGVKFWGAVVISKALAKHDIVRPGGSLTLTSGGQGLRPARGAVIGGALNGGVLTMTRALADELGADGRRIRVNTVVPGLVKTPLWDKLGYSADRQAELFAKGEASLPVGFVATPAEIAEAYLYAVRADYATGTLVVIDGGGSL